MTQFAIIIYGHGGTGTAEELAEHDQHAQDLIDDGAMVAAFALAPHTETTSVSGDGVTDGPYTEAKEVVAGIGIVEAPDREAALAIARRNPATWQGGGVEVREVIGSYLRPEGATRLGGTADTLVP